MCETAFATNMPFKVVTSILNFYIPTVIITVLYVRIFIAIKQRSKDIVKFGAYTASGVTSISAKKSIKRQQNGHQNGVEEVSQKKTEVVENETPEKKIEFHRLAVVAFPLERKCNKKGTSEHKIYQSNLGKVQKNLHFSGVWRK